MVAAWRPDLSIQVPFNVDPNEPTAAPTSPAAFNIGSYRTPVAIPAWSDLSSLWLGADGVTRGRQYELDTNQASQPSMTWVDPNEYLNPANTAGPYYPNVLPLRQLTIQGTWPNPASGNLMNTNQPDSPVLCTGPVDPAVVAAGGHPGSIGYDPSFESYSVGNTPKWLLGNGATPSIATTDPFQGTKHVTWDVSISKLEQGCVWVVPTVPGTQYTASAYVKQTAANTLAIAVSDLTEAADAFNRTVATGWGTADIGGTWTNVGGTSVEYSVVPGSAMIAPAALNSSRKVVVGTACADVNVTGYVSVDQIATGAAMTAALVMRYVDASNFVYCPLVFNTDQTLTLKIVERVAGVETTLSTNTLTFPYLADETIIMQCRSIGGSYSVLAWRQDTPRPDDYTDTVTTGTFLTAGQVGTYGFLATGNTNVAPMFAWPYFGAYATVVGTTTTTSGSYVRLSQTFTAGQPYHRLRVNTVGAVASTATVRLDALQYEPGASASAFTTSGSTIYPVSRGFVERWPSEWDNQGFLGRCEATAVDAFEPLNLYSLNTAYYQQVLSTSPYLYWPLNDSSGSTVYGEQSGNNGPALVNYPSPHGGDVAPAAGGSLAIPGDTGGTGVEFTSQATISASTGTILGYGRTVNRATNFSYPLLGGGAWGATLACWVVADVPKYVSPDAQVLIWPILAGTNPNLLVPINIGIGSDSFMEVDYSGATTAGFLGGIGPTLTDGLPHLLVATVQQDATNTVVASWVDGTAGGGSATVATASLGGVLTQAATSIMVGGFFAYTAYEQIVNGSMGHVALWDRVLSDDEILALWAAGGLGNAGDTSGERITKFLTPSWNGQTSIDTGSSLMGISDITSGTAVLDACQATAVAEQGNFWADKEGVIRFSGRQSRYLNLTSKWTFGENTAGGEYPYQENLGYDFDPTFIENRVQVDNADGVTVTSADASSQRSFFTRSGELGANLQSDEDAIQLANWVLNKHDQPAQRIASITLDPAGYPLLWPVVLAIEINDRVTVVRRPKSANGGAGITMSGDFFVEQISHDQIDMAAGTWRTTLLLSPVDESANVFIFDNATWGLFGGPGVLGF